MVLRPQGMQWIRVDHYFSGDPENPESFHPPDAVHAVRERAVRGRLSGRGDDAQRGRA